MKAVLFGHNVDYFDEIFSENQCYDMSNLVVSAVHPTFQSYPDEMQIHINTSSSIKKVDADDPSAHFTSKLSKISELPRHQSPYNATYGMTSLLKFSLHSNCLYLKALLLYSSSRYDCCCTPHNAYEESA